MWAHFYFVMIFDQSSCLLGCMYHAVLLMCTGVASHIKGGGGGRGGARRPFKGCKKCMACGISLGFYDGTLTIHVSVTNTLVSFTWESPWGSVLDQMDWNLIELYIWRELGGGGGRRGWFRGGRCRAFVLREIIVCLKFPTMGQCLVR